jgi:sulfur relay protein TusB/DsrH
MKILHIIRNLEDHRAVATLKRQQEKGHSVTLLLLQDAVLSRLSWEGKILACQEDVQARTGTTRFPTVDYEEIVRLIFEHDRVISW